jgi:isopenicillin-N epimerase
MEVKPATVVPPKAKGQGSANYSRAVELLYQSDADYTPPALPFPQFAPALEAEWAKNGAPAFGSEMSKWFHFKEGVHFLNHGSYGALPRPVKEVHSQWLAHVEENPCQWFNVELFPLVAHSTRALAKFVGAKPQELAFARNSTTAINAILRSFPFQSGDALLCMNFTYNAIKKTMQYLLPKQKVDVIEIHIDSKPTGQQVIDKIKEALENDKEKKIRLVLLDHIISPLGMVLPMKELVDLVHAHGARVLVDGAHVVGQIPLNLKELNADYLVSNCHKWLYAPRGCAMIWVKEEFLDEVRPVVISHGYDQGFHAEFIWQATDDYTPFVSLLSALKFVELCGPEKIQKYNKDLVSWAAEMLAKEWNTAVVVPPEDYAALALIRMPKPTNHAEDGEGADAISQLLWKDFKVEAMIFPLPELGLVVRISGQIYLDRDNYTHFAKAVLALIQQNRY